MSNEETVRLLAASAEDTARVSVLFKAYKAEIVKVTPFDTNGTDIASALVSLLIDLINDAPQSWRADLRDQSMAALQAMVKA